MKKENLLQKVIQSIFGNNKKHRIHIKCDVT